MSDILKIFESAKEDRIVDKNDLATKLRDFTLADWQAVARANGKGNSLLSDFSVEEKENEFVVHNDKDAIHDEKILRGVSAFLTGCATTAIGFGAGCIAASRLGNPWLKLAGAGVGFLGGYINYKVKMNGLDEIERTAFPLRIPKDQLPEGKTAMLESSRLLNQAMLAGSFTGALDRRLG